MKFKPSLKQTMAENQTALDNMAKLFGKAPVVIPPIKGMPQSRLLQPATVRTVRGLASARKLPSEGEVQASIIEYLLHHPKVALVVRFNSGAAMTEGRNGKSYPIWFNKIYKRGLRIVDLDVTLKTGRRMVIEVKRPDWSYDSRDQRQLEQHDYLAFHRSVGNIGIFARSIEDVSNALMEA